MLFFFSALSPPSFYHLHHNNHQNHDNHYDQDNHNDQKSDDLDFDNQVSSSYGSSLALAGTSSDETEPFLTTLHASGRALNLKAHSQNPPNCVFLFILAFLPDELDSSILKRLPATPRQRLKHLNMSIISVFKNSMLFCSSN